MYIIREYVTQKFKVVATGGTFDEIHIGHLALLSKAFELGKKVIIGVSSDEFADRVKGKGKITHSYQQRVARLRLLIQRNFGDVNYEISKLNTSYGPTVISDEVGALIVSSETSKRGSEINEVRSRKGLKPLTIVTVDLVRAEDGNPISSSRIRTGQIDPQGKLL
ncbi:MAG TPA: pantetheine-phosphate adenylyltransferase [Candidatus Bathyarchaeia archaeon]|nr:pantetheine-phosphate adenylyltransferase [Candidatus Bathyarchaeia archaeon]